MLGFTKFSPMEYAIHYSNGRIAHEGRGISFFYWIPTSSIVAVPLSSNDLPFVFNEVTADFQTVTVQGQITYRVRDPKALSNLLDFTRNREDATEEALSRLAQRLVNEAQTATKTYVSTLGLREVLRSADAVAAVILAALRGSDGVRMLGIETLGAAILNIAPTPEMARALEAEAREKLQQRADEAIYSRRNNAVEQERKIKESELNTQIAVEEKNRQIREAKTAADISVETQRKTLIELKSANDRKDADTRAYALKAVLEPVSQVEWKTLLALGKGGVDPTVIISHAFRELAENAGKIGTLNITPDLLQTVMEARTK